MVVKKKRKVNFINKIIEGDCLEVMKNIPNKSVDMILCDLPYGTTQNKWDSVIPLDKLWEQYEKSFKAGGVNDIRKLMDARDKEMAELDDILKRRNGEVFFTAETTLKQGNPYSSNTSLLADQVLRYQALHLGE